ncbi:MAG: hypothetical protein K6F96_07035 [Bacteroidales bacterium]|nr:hypothetical protein [Bacteroidales bacterium]
MKKTLLIMTLAVVSVFAFSGCNAEKQAARQFAVQQSWYEQRGNNIKVNTVREPQQKFHDLNRGLEVHVSPTQPKEEITKHTNTEYIYHYSGKNYFNVATTNYVRSMGLTEMSPTSDYKLLITINCADANSFTGARWVDLSIRLLDNKGKEVFSQKDLYSAGKNGQLKSSMFDEAYTQALEQINWNRIASFLRTEQLPKDEPQKQVQGLGDTALEQTIIRWDVQSRPQGADIFWRVVSKTPEVKSTNNKYLQTTPYEATKALDIKGLTYQTSGNVRIILRCEKDGYLPQEKEFDVRMVLDQEEISAFFRLVKDE